ncbi:hypothetical protein ACFL46_04145, partial [Candidatus Neomarinimicrobiota bacterium]
KKNLQIGDKRFNGVLRIKYLVKAGFDFKKIKVDKNSVGNSQEIVCSLPLVEAQGVSKVIPEWLIRTELHLKTKKTKWWNEIDEWMWADPDDKKEFSNSAFWEKCFNEEIKKITHSQLVNPTLKIVIEKMAKEYVSDLLHLITGKKVKFIADKNLSSSLKLVDYLSKKHSTKQLSEPQID